MEPWKPDPAKIKTAAHFEQLDRVSLQTQIDAERDRRQCDGFFFEGKRYQTRPDDRENIAGAASAALAAITLRGRTFGDYYWHGGETDFEWIAADNTTTKMDAPTMFAFGQAAMNHKSSMIFAARVLKDMDQIPADFTSDAYWPVA